MNKKKFTAEYLPEALEQLAELSEENQDKILEAIGIFEEVGTDYKNINDLEGGLFEIKPKGVRAYFMYNSNRRGIIIIGFICLKKTQEAPARYKKQARKLITDYLAKEKKELENAKAKNNR